jgi:hypothetical protein
VNDLYKPAQIAAVIGFTPETVRSYLALKFPAHQRGTWWKLERNEYEFAIAEMRAADAISPGQPLRALKRPQQLIPLF